MNIRGSRQSHTCTEEFYYPNFGLRMHIARSHLHTPLNAHVYSFLFPVLILLSSGRDVAVRSRAGWYGSGLISIRGVSFWWQQPVMCANSLREV